MNPRFNAGNFSHIRPRDHIAQSGILTKLLLVVMIGGLVMYTANLVPAFVTGGFEAISLMERQSLGIIAAGCVLSWLLVKWNNRSLRRYDAKHARRDARRDSHHKP